MCLHNPNPNQEMHINGRMRQLFVVCFIVFGGFGSLILQALAAVCPVSFVPYTITTPYNISATDVRDTALDIFGNLFVVDYTKKVVWRVDAITQAVTLYAGQSGVSTPNTGLVDNVNATLSTFTQPVSIAIDSSGTIYVADYYDNRVRKIDNNTQIISTLVSPSCSPNSCRPSGVSVDKDGNIWISATIAVFKVSAGTSTLVKIIGGGQGDGGAFNQASVTPGSSLRVNNAGILYIGDFVYKRIRVANMNTQTLTTISGVSIQ
jgi:hypothetical protein